MSKIFVTGISGTGKTTIANFLNKNGIYSVSLDEVSNLCFWRNKSTGISVDYKAELNMDFINSHDWICDIGLLRQLLNLSKNIFVFGIVANQNEFISLFDKVLLLQCKPQTFIQRTEQRKDNDFGKNKCVQEFILDTYQKFEKDLLDKGAISIDAEKPIEDVEEAIVKFI